MNPIGESTAVTLGFVGVIVSVTIWIVNIQAKGNENEARINRIAEDVITSREEISVQSGDIKAIRAIVERIDRKVSP